MKSVLTKVELGEVDAGVVYVTDVRPPGDKVKGIEIPADVNASTELPDRRTDQGAERRDGARRSSTTCCRRTARACWRPPGSQQPVSRRSGAPRLRAVRDRRAARADRRAGAGRVTAVPARCCVPALVAVAVPAVPLAGAAGPGPVGRAWPILARPDALEALRLSLWTATVGHG